MDRQRGTDSKESSSSGQFCQTIFHALHAFRFVNAADEARYARYHWEPEAGVAGQTLEELQNSRRHISLKN